ncbi:tRNA (adenosine(37)-N6)-threonylcarbamoyltransferase complex dimerization subunit type 1 TsaB [candidate division KSB1 bacterium]|nr:tRNA (adenosine(37)-N6)-threonylcarbamoyltransferase complex dimerization subunit type 1 TsaB [candidate division KSB1 bacterium]
MTVLGMTTATQTCSIALVKDEILIGEYRLNVRNIHARWIVGAIDHLCASTEISIKSLEGIAVAIGPGSFTGLRIGLSVAKGLSFQLPVRFTGVNTLQALAVQTPILNGNICALIKSRKNEYYAAKYHKTEAKLKLNGDIQVLQTHELQTFITDDTWIAGLIDKDIETIFAHHKVYFVPPVYNEPTGYSIAMLGYEQIQVNILHDIQTVEPMYFQDFIAKKQRQ